MKALILFALLLSPNLAAQSFEGLSDAIEQGNFGEIKSVIISRHGEVIYEDYFRGTTAQDLHQVQSVTKSIDADEPHGPRGHRHGSRSVCRTGAV